MGQDKRLSRSVFALALLAVVGGCAGTPKGTLPLAQPFLEVERKDNFRTEGYLGTEPSVIRTFAGPRGRTEIAVPDCVLLSETYALKFATPARILIPDYGQASPEPVVSCIHNGRQQAAVLDVRRNGTAGPERAQRRGGGFLTVGVGVNARLEDPAAVLAVATVASLLAISAFNRRDRAQSFDRVNLVFAEAGAPGKAKAE